MSMISFFIPPRMKIKTLESNKEYLERNLKESENSLRELVAQKMGTLGQ